MARPLGSKNAKTLEIEAEARKHRGDALAALVSIAKKSESDQARVSASIALLDRGYGKPRQTTDLTHHGPIEVTVIYRDEGRKSTAG